jgi:hypothetical protein
MTPLLVRIGRVQKKKRKVKERERERRSETERTDNISSCVTPLLARIGRVCNSYSFPRKSEMRPLNFFGE